MGYYNSSNPEWIFGTYWFGVTEVFFKFWILIFRHLVLLIIKRYLGLGHSQQRWAAHTVPWSTLSSSGLTLPFQGALQDPQECPVSLWRPMRAPRTRLEHCPTNPFPIGSPGATGEESCLWYPNLYCRATTLSAFLRGPAGIRINYSTPEKNRWLKNSVRTQLTRGWAIWHHQSLATLLLLALDILTKLETRRWSKILYH